MISASTAIFSALRLLSRSSLFLAPLLQCPYKFLQVLAPLLQCPYKFLQVLAPPRPLFYHIPCSQRSYLDPCRVESLDSLFVGSLRSSFCGISRILFSHSFFSPVLPNEPRLLFFRSFFLTSLAYSFANVLEEFAFRTRPYSKASVDRATRQGRRIRLASKILSTCFSSIYSSFAQLWCKNKEISWERKRSTPCIFNEKILQATVRLPTVQYHRDLIIRYHRDLIIRYHRDLIIMACK
jgi:hypothetical protein